MYKPEKSAIMEQVPQTERNQLWHRKSPISERFG